MQSVDFSKLVQAVKIAVYKTGHEIADTVAEAVHAGLPESILKSTSDNNQRANEEADIFICYGILRGADTIFRMAQATGKPFICIDRGYWKPGHFDGYYRISLNGTQQTTGLDKLEPDYERWDKLGLEILPEKVRSGYVTVCPPTKEVDRFFNYPSMPYPWPNEPMYIRHKDYAEPLQNDLDRSKRIITFNSSVGWEALRQGIPCESDSCFSFVGAYKKYFDHENLMDIDSRRRMFAVQAGLQLTLEEIRQGLLWPVLEKLLDTSQERRKSV